MDQITEFQSRKREFFKGYKCDGEKFISSKVRYIQRISTYLYLLDITFTPVRKDFQPHLQVQIPDGPNLDHAMK